MSLKVGTRAPDFRLPAAGGEDVGLSDYTGKVNVVLFFYPKDETPGCTAEACAFRDSYEEFLRAGAEVLGISSDSVVSHATFAARHELPMRLLADVDGRVRAAYAVEPFLGLAPGRETVIVDRQGIVRHVFRSQVRMKRHVEEALRVVATLDRPSE